MRVKVQLTEMPVKTEIEYGPPPRIERRKAPRGDEHRQILGLQFFAGTVQQAIDRMRRGGLLVVPSAPMLTELGRDACYREAAQGADLLIPDSAYMVMIWNRLGGKHIARLSGLQYLRVLLMQADAREYGNTIWVMAGEASAKRNLAWLEHQGIQVRSDCIYTAPMYGAGPVADKALLALVEEHRPQHVVITLGGGSQEKLGLYLRRNLSYLPAIHCIGAAIAFLSGDQVYIPVWADRLYMGWLLRILWQPKKYLPRYWEARKLLPLMLRYRSELPPFSG